METQYGKPKLDQVHLLVQVTALDIPLFRYILSNLGDLLAHTLSELII